MGGRYPVASSSSSSPSPSSSPIIPHWGMISQFIPHLNEHPGKKAVVDYLDLHLYPYLVKGVPKVYPRQRWMGCEEAFRDVGPICCMNDMLRETYQTYLRAMPKSAAASADEPPPIIQALSEAAAGDAVSGVGSNTQGTSEADEPHRGPRSAEESSKMRTKALQWLQAKPAAMLLLMRRIMGIVIPTLQYWVGLSADVAETFRWSEMVKRHAVL